MAAHHNLTAFGADLVRGSGKSLIEKDLAVFEELAAQHAVPAGT